jgi:hypothetical protein
MNIRADTHGIFRRLSLAMIVAAALVAGFPGLSAADPTAQGSDPDRPIYQYTDQHGGVAFTDDPSHIPVQARSTAKTVKLPPLIKIPDPAPQPQPQPDPPSLFSRIQSWFDRLTTGSRLILAGILPIAILLLAGLSFLRRRTDSTIIRIALRLGMAAIVLLSVSVSYVVVMHAQAATLTGSVLHGDDLATSLTQEGKALNSRVLNIFHSSFHSSDDADEQPTFSP